MVAKVHEQSHLLIGDWATGQSPGAPIEKPRPYPADHSQPDTPQKGNASRVGGACSGYALAASPHTGFSS
jgi:hypothetical protein